MHKIRKKEINIVIKVTKIRVILERFKIGMFFSRFKNISVRDPIKGIFG